MGHAITARLLTKEKVIVYLGSHGDQQSSMRLLAGNLEIWAQKNPLKWRGGVCLFSDRDPKQQYNIVLAGPLASLLLFAVTLSLLVAFHTASVAIPLLVYFCIWSALIFVSDIIPARRTITLNDGGTILNDGARLKTLRLAKRQNSQIK
jgi:hypothetical protein